MRRPYQRQWLLLGSVAAINLLCSLKLLPSWGNMVGVRARGWAPQLCMCGLVHCIMCEVGQRHWRLKQERQGPYRVCILTGHTCIYGRLAAELGSLQSRAAWLRFLMSTRWLSTKVVMNSGNFLIIKSVYSLQLLSNKGQSTEPFYSLIHLKC